jgi:hypothetical protein
MDQVIQRIRSIFRVYILGLHRVSQIIHKQNGLKRLPLHVSGHFRDMAIPTTNAKIGTLPGRN